MNYLKVYYFEGLEYWEIFQSVYFIDFYFNPLFHLYDFNSFQFVEVCFLTPGMVYLGEYSMCILKKMYILLLLGGMFSKCQLYPVD